MTASPELIHDLRASRPAAPAAVRETVQGIAASEGGRSTFRRRLPSPGRRLALIAVPAAAALALASAGIMGLAHPEGQRGAVQTTAASDSSSREPAPTTPEKALPQPAPRTGSFGGSGSTTLAAPNRAQRVTATLTVEVADSNAVSSAAQDVLDTTRALGGHVLSASVATGDVGKASLTVRVPVAKVQEAIVSFSSLGKITQQQVSVDDLQESLDALTRRATSLKSQIVGITARLTTSTLDPATRARLEARRRTLRSQLRAIRRGIESTSAEARFATMQLTVVTPDALGVVPAPSRLDRTFDGALNALVWEGVVTLAALVVVAPFALVAVAAWLAHRLYRRRENERLLAAS